MKFKAFFKLIEEIIKNYPDIDLKTLKIVMKEFYYHLSDKEKDKHFSLYFIGIEEKISIQKTIIKTLRDNKIAYLEFELNLLKKSIT